MKHCEICNVHVYPQHAKCPLCGEKLGNPAPSITAYPTVYPVAKKSFVFNVFTFICIVAAAVCGFVNIFEPSHPRYIWSLIVLASIIPLWVIVASFVSKKISPGAKLLNTLLAVIASTLSLDILTGFHKWSTTYIIPFSAISLTAVLTIFAIKNRTRYQEYLGYLLATFFVSICPIFIFLLSLSNAAWTAYAAVFYALLTVIGFWIFADKGFRSEMKKKFHL